MQAPIDVATLSKSFLNKKDIVCSVLGVFVDGFSGFPNDYSQAETASDIYEMFRLAHSLKGSAANIRAGLLSAEAARLQNMLKSLQPDSVEVPATENEVQQQFQLVVQELERVVKFIADYRANTTNDS